MSGERPAVIRQTAAKSERGALGSRVAVPGKLTKKVGVAPSPRSNKSVASKDMAQPLGVPLAK